MTRKYLVHTLAKYFTDQTLPSKMRKRWYHAEIKYFNSISDDQLKKDAVEFGLIKESVRL